MYVLIVISANIDEWSIYIKGNNDLHNKGLLNKHAVLMYTVFLTNGNTQKIVPTCRYLSISKHVWNNHQITACSVFSSVSIVWFTFVHIKSQLTKWAYIQMYWYMNKIEMIQMIQYSLYVIIKFFCFGLISQTTQNSLIIISSNIFINAIYYIIHTDWVGHMVIRI